MALFECYDVAWSSNAAIAYQLSSVPNSSQQNRVGRPGDSPGGHAESLSVLLSFVSTYAHDAVDMPIELDCDWSDIVIESIEHDELRLYP